MFVELISPEGTMYRDDADSVTLPAGDGEITVLTHHLPLMTTVLPGTVIIRKGTEEFYFAVTRGVTQVNELSLRILADTADRVDALEEAAIELARTRAEQMLREKRGTDAGGFADATAQLERQIAMLRSVRRRGNRRPSRSS